MGHLVGENPERITPDSINNIASDNRWINRLRLHERFKHFDRDMIGLGKAQMGRSIAGRFKDLRVDKFGAKA